VRSDMQKANNLLSSWAIQFIKNKDAYFGKIQSIEEKSEGFDNKVVYSDKTEYLLIVPSFLKNEDFKNKLSKDKNIIIFVLNNQNNFDYVLSNWKFFIEFQKLTLYFVNIYSHSETKWALRPYVHNLFSDQKSLKNGLMSIFMSVEQISESEIEQKGL
jgi:hypothetical protein